MRLEDIILLLRALPLFAEVGGEALRLLAFSAQSRSYRAGDTLFRRGEMADGAFLITGGEVVMDSADDGSPDKPSFGVGVLLGQSALFAPVERPATALARGPVSVLVISRDLMFKVLDAYPETAVALRNALSHQASAMAGALGRISLPSAAE